MPAIVSKKMQKHEMKQICDAIENAHIEKKKKEGEAIFFFLKKSVKRCEMKF